MPPTGTMNGGRCLSDDPGSRPLPKSADTPSIDEEAISLGLLARDMHRAISRAIDARVARYGLASNQCRYLAMIRSRDGITPKELGDYLGVRSPTVLAALRTLEEKRLVRRSRDASDGRKSPYSLTPRGEEVEAHVRQAAFEVEQLVVGVLPPEDVRAFQRMVTAVRHALEANLGDVVGTSEGPNFRA